MGMRFMNVFGVTWTPTGGSAQICTGVASISVEGDDRIESYMGDGDRFASTAANSTSDRKVSVHFADLSQAVKITPVPGALSFTVGAIKSSAVTIAVGSGALTGTLSPCLSSGVKYSGEHAKFGTATVEFIGFTADGITDPLTWVTL